MIEEQLIQLENWQNEETKRILNLKASKHQQQAAQKDDEPLICDTQYNNTIPVIDAHLLLKVIENAGEEKEKMSQSTIENKYRLQNELYNIFFDGSGCFILKNMYNTSMMEMFNSWCEEMIEGANEEVKVAEEEVNVHQNASKDKNFIHPTQKGKFLINDVLSRLAETNPLLLYQLLYDSNGAFVLHWLVDVLLGFGKIGAAAAHWITPNSNNKQFSHVDFPLNINSSPFWGMSEERLRKFTTMTQMNLMLPHYSCQVLIATDSMNERNGSTEVIPCSQKISNIDLAITKGSKFYNKLEQTSFFQNVKLDQGDVLFFNRRLVHRGGANGSQKRRNALIMQYVWLWGVGQEILDVNVIVPKLIEIHQTLKPKDEKEPREAFEDFLVRIQPPYPKDTRLGT